MNKKAKRVISAACAALIVCSMLGACGNKNEKSAESTKAKTASEGESTTSAFTGKKNNSEQSPAASAVGQNIYTSGTDENKMPANTVQSELDDAQSFAMAGMTDDASEMLGYISRDSLSEEQKAQYDDIQAMLSDGADGEDVFTPSEAVRIVKERYGVSPQGDMDGMRAQTDSSGLEYYRMQIEVTADNTRKTIDVYKNGDIIEISSEPLAFG